MSHAKPRVPAMEGWFTADEDGPRLRGLRDRESGTFFFPMDVAVSRAPGYAEAELEEVELSRRGRLWSWTTNHYAPPAPYVAPDPFVPYTVTAVELPAERMVVLGPLAEEVDPARLELGMEMELVVGTLFEDDEAVHTVWKWRPVDHG